MQYKGSYLGRKVDFKRRLSLPKKWVDTTLEFCFVVKEIGQTTEIRLYPSNTWEELLHSKTKEDEKTDFAKKTTHVELKQKRLLLPKSCTWQKVDLIGVLDFIIIVESVV